MRAVYLILVWSDPSLDLGDSMFIWFIAYISEPGSWGTGSSETASCMSRNGRRRGCQASVVLRCEGVTFWIWRNPIASTAWLNRVDLILGPGISRSVFSSKSIKMSPGAPSSPGTERASVLHACRTLPGKITWNKLWKGGTSIGWHKGSFQLTLQMK